MTDDATQLQIEIVEQAIHCLNWRQRVVFNLRYLVDPPVTYRRIGYLLGVGNQTTATIEKKAMKRLRKQIVMQGYLPNLREIGIYMEKDYYSGEYIFFDKWELLPENHPMQDT